MPNAEIKKPLVQHNPAVNIAWRGPTSSTQRPKVAADTPKTKIAIEKIQPSAVNFQSFGADRVMPINLVIGKLKTLNA
jgi:hypothetical protein